eukprot:gene20028-21991_t
MTVLASRPKELSVRLTGGSAKNEGFLELFNKGEWKQVSNSKWDLRSSIVVCKQLGYGGVNGKSKRVSNYISSLRFFRRNFLCQGSERTLADCETAKIIFWQMHLHCRTGKEVWVSCKEKPQNTLPLEPPISESSGKVNHLEVKLRDLSTNQNEATARGVLEINYNGKWLHVCSDGWTEENSRVACSHLGYTTNMKDDFLDDVKYTLPSYHGMKDVRCKGNELSLLSCDHAGFKKHHKCKKSVLLSCKTLKDRKKAKYVRLRAGQLESEGRVELFIHGEWGTVCDRNWDLADANVVCKQLGFGSAAKAVHWAEYGQGTTRVLFSKFACNGTESDIHSCQYELPGKSCEHYRDAGVQCNYPRAQTKKVRLVGGPSRIEGRVEVQYKGRWYAVCGVYFTDLDGNVVCRELGLGFLAKAYSTWNYGIKDIGIYEPRCKGNETSLLKCNHRPWFRGACRYYDMASVKCTYMAPDIVMDIKAMQPSIKVNTWHLRDLKCSMEENCLAKTAYARNAFIDPKANLRRLLVFTSRILNRGTATFRPNRAKEQWEWHSCHKHYHSMEYFAQYDVIDFHGRRVAEGHKASFCLEDTGCDYGAMKMYNCTDKGDQGISVGCADNYSNAIDCQWVDITDIKDGNYSLMVHINPKGGVVESDYDNNVATCEIHYHDYQVDVGRCGAEPCKQRSYGGTGYGMCCHFPFIYNGTEHNSCTAVNSDGAAWCSTTFDMDKDDKWGYCKETIEDSNELSESKKKRYYGR